MTPQLPKVSDGESFYSAFLGRTYYAFEAESGSEYATALGIHNLLAEALDHFPQFETRVRSGEAPEILIQCPKRHHLVRVKLIVVMSSEGELWQLTQTDNPERNMAISAFERTRNAHVFDAMRTRLRCNRCNAASPKIRGQNWTVRGDSLLRLYLEAAVLGKRSASLSRLQA